MKRTVRRIGDVILRMVLDIELINKPEIGNAFIVEPKEIDESLFMKRRRNPQQEEIRQLIVESLAQMKVNPEKYGEKFETIRPIKSWRDAKTFEEFQQWSSKIGHMADWVEFAFECAQRICNGESWRAVCNKKDKSIYKRIIIWKNGCARAIGSDVESKEPETYIGEYDYCKNEKICNAIPLIARKI